MFTVIRYSLRNSRGAIIGFNDVKWAAQQKEVEDIAIEAAKVGATWYLGIPVRNMEKIYTGEMFEGKD